MLKKTIFSLVMLIACASLSIGYFFFKKPQVSKQSNPRFTIGILQTASHPALDQARDAFIAHLKSTLGTDVTFIIHNAEGSMANAHASAKSFSTQPSISGICALGTLAAQAATHNEKKKPIFFTAVSDPEALGILQPGSNVCGVPDRVDTKTLVAVLRSLVPQAKRVALLYNPAEINAASGVKNMEQELNKHALAWTHACISHEADIVHVVQNACKSADALLVPVDNTTACAISLVSRITLQTKTPLFVSDNLLMIKGVLASVGVNYTELGQETADIALDVLLHDKQPDAFLNQPERPANIFIHKQTAALLNIKVPEKLAQTATLVE